MLELPADEAARADYVFIPRLVTDGIVYLLQSVQVENDNAEFDRFADRETLFEADFRLAVRVNVPDARQRVRVRHLFRRPELHSAVMPDIPLDERMDQARRDEASDGVKRHKRVDRLQNDEKSHHKTGDADRSVILSVVPLRPHRDEERVRRSRQEQDHLRYQSDEAHLTGDVNILRREVKHDRDEEIDYQANRRKNDDPPSRGGEDLAESPLFPEKRNDVSRPEKDGKSHRRKIQHGVHIHGGNDPRLV